MFVPRVDPICIDGVLNAVSFKTKYLDEVAVTGRGAGGRETARALVTDLTNLEKEIAYTTSRFEHNIRCGASK